MMEIAWRIVKSNSGIHGNSVSASRRKQKTDRSERTGNTPRERERRDVMPIYSCMGVRVQMLCIS